MSGRIREPAHAIERLRAALAEDIPSHLLVVETEAGFARAAELVWASVVERDPTITPRPELTRVAMQAEDALLLEIDLTAKTPGIVWLRASAGGAAPIYYVEEVVLSSERRQQGRGSHALRLIERAARQLGALGLALDFMLDNARVESLYTRLGYLVVGHDLQKPADAARAKSDRPLETSQVVPPDVASLAASIAHDRTVSRFERPGIDPAELSGELRDSLQSGSDFAWLTRDEHGTGYIWYQLKQSRLSGAPIVNVVAFGGCSGPYGGQRALSLLSATESHAESLGRSGPMFLTLWDAEADLLTVLTGAGFRVVRKKMFKDLRRGVEA